MEFKQYTLTDGAQLLCYLRTPTQEMPGFVRRPAVVVVPGGGYGHLSPREADPVALQFAAAGYHAFVLMYGILEGAQNEMPLRQASEALALLRAHADEWGIIPDKIAICGFSAGGHLALSSAVFPLPGEEAATQQRPNAVILGYPVVSGGEYAHRGSFETLTGSKDLSVHARYSLENYVTSAMPPVFLWHTVSDNAVPVENSLMLISAMQKAHVSYEAHLFPTGEHGMSLCTPEVNARQAHNAHWLPLAIEWLASTFDFHAENF